MSKAVLFLVNHEIVIYNFRKELVKELLQQGYEVYISSPSGKKIDLLVNMGAKHIETPINRHGIGIIEDHKLMRYYSKMMKRIKPIVVLTYTIKPNIYGGLAAKKNKIPYIANITGLGTAVEKPGILQKVTTFLYKRAFSKINTVFFQNEENMQFFVDRKIALGKHKLLPGSGVNLDEFKYVEYPNDDIVKFAFVSRIMKEKGIDLYLDAAKEIKRTYPNTEFHVCGFCEEDYIPVLKKYQDEKIIIYHGMIDDVKSFMASVHCLIHPSSYPEGMSNVLLEAAATGRPIITTDRSGCREIVDHGKNGFIISSPYNSDKLQEIIEEFLKLDANERRIMGINGRTFIEEKFDRNIVVNNYMKIVNNERRRNEL